jgi:hypothetical protein
MNLKGYGNTQNSGVPSFLAKAQLKYSGELVSYINEVLKSSKKRKLTARQIQAMSVSGMKRMLNIKNDDQKVIILIDSIERIKYFLSPTVRSNWKYTMEKKLKNLMSIGNKLYSLGLDIQFVFVSSVHLDLGVSGFNVNFMSEEHLCRTVIA